MYIRTNREFQQAIPGLKETQYFFLLLHLVFIIFFKILQSDLLLCTISLYIYIISNNQKSTTIKYSYNYNM